MLKRYDGKVVLVTASASGIGYGISKRMAEEGATVIISSRNQKNVDSAVDDLKKLGLKAEGFVCHVGVKEQRDSLYQHIKEKYGRLDVLVLNAAVSTQFGSVFDTTEKQFDKTFDVNVKGVFFMVKDYHSLMPAGSSILLIASYVGYSLDTNIGIYSLSKTTVLGLTKLLARALRDNEIRVNCIAPGLIRTKFAGSLLEYEEVLKQKLEIDRVGEPEDIAAGAAFLCSKDASYVNGENLNITGFISQRL